MKFLLFLTLFVVNVDSFLISDIEINVCIDSERVDFKNSCIDKDPECIHDLNYLKTFQDFEDFYVRFKGEIYHAFEDVLYYQKCEITKRVDVPEIITECTRDIPVSFIDIFGSNKTGYLTEYEVIRPKNHQTLTKRQVCTTGADKILYSLPDGLRTLVRIGTELDLISINRLGKAYEIMIKEAGTIKASYKKYLQSNLDDLIIKDVFISICIIMVTVVTAILVILLNLFIKEKNTDKTNDEALTVVSEDPKPNSVKTKASEKEHLIFLDSKSKKDLVQMAKELNVDHRGNKDDIIDRLKENILNN